MTNRAVFGKIACDMVRIRCTCIIRFMALVTPGVCQIVITVRVARLTGRRLMRPRQREERRCMIERRRFPRGCAVTLRTVVIEIRRDVIGIQHLREIVLLALVAPGVCQIVIAVGVARLSGCRLMRTRQREERRCMIKSCRFPCGGCMARGTIVIEIRRDVIGILHLREIVLVALIAAGVRKIVIAVCVTVLTQRCLMRARQREKGRCMIERRRLPALHCMAGQAIPVESSARVIRIFRPVEILLMASNAFLRSPGKDHSAMALFALDLPVRAEKRERSLIVIDGKRHPVQRLPCIGVMAVGALHRKADKRVVRLGRLLVGFRMTSLTIEREAGIFAPDVALLTFDAQMRTGQPEIRQIVIKPRGFPACGRVARFAVMRELPFDVIRKRCGCVVVVMAGPARNRKFRNACLVTRCARCCCMRPFQCKRCQAMVEGCRSPFDRLMTCRAFLAVSSCNMIGLYGIVVVVAVASIAIGQRAFIPLGVAIIAIERCVRGTVHEFEVRMHKAAFPGEASHLVALRAVYVEIRLYMIQLLRILIIVPMTRNTIGRCIAVFFFLLIDMT